MIKHLIIEPKHIKLCKIFMVLKIMLIQRNGKIKFLIKNGKRIERKKNMKLRKNIILLIFLKMRILYIIYYQKNIIM